MIQCFFQSTATVTYTTHGHHHQAKNMHTAVNRFISVYTHCYQTPRV